MRWCGHTDNESVSVRSKVAVDCVAFAMLRLWGIL